MCAPVYSYCYDCIVSKYGSVNKQTAATISLKNRGPNILSARVDERPKPCWWSISSFKIIIYMGPHNADVKTEI